MILGAVGMAIAIPLLGITISFASVSANVQQDANAQENANAQQEANATVVAAPTPAAVPASADSPIESVDSQPAQPLLPDPLAPEPSASSLPAPEVVTAPTPVAPAESIVEQTPSATPSPILTVKASKPTDAQDAQGVQAPRAVKKETDVARSWTPPVLNPGTVSLRAPKLSSGQQATLTVACSPSVNCVINGDQLTFSEGTQVTVTYSAKATATHRAWSKTISN